MRMMVNVVNEIRRDGVMGHEMLNLPVLSADHPAQPACC